MSRFITAVMLVLSGAAIVVGDQRPNGMAPVNSPLATFRGLVEMCSSSLLDSDRALAALHIAACASYLTGFVQGSIATQGAIVMENVSDQVVKGTVAPTPQSVDTAIRKGIQQMPKLWCIEADWTPDYVRAVMLQYVREHPTTLDDAPDAHMLKILAKAFPCSGS